MALKKSELYSSLWASCDALRGGMDASQYKDYVLVLLFIKYISDKYAGVPFAPITIPKGAGFKDMVSLKGKSDIGDQINKKIIAPLANANAQLSLSDFPDFNDPVKLGDGKEKVERLTNLVAIFEDKRLDFSRNRAEGDDILGDAYEYLMRHFATESGKSKGQFYTPSEVSQIMAKILGIREAKTSADTTVYDPTCGSGSLLLKVADEAGTPVSIYGQEKDAATSGLARMNMYLHNNPTALIHQGNTLADPKFKEDGILKSFDYVVANPPFSDKRWSTGIDPLNDPFERFKAFGAPPAKQGDYAYLLHIVRSLKSNGKGACILPHGVLFRGNAEADIRRALVRKGYIKGIIGLPPNLFYGTGIPACIIVIDKEGAGARKGIFMIDASKGFMKDGPKNRLRAQDIHRIVDVFTKRQDVDKYARMVPFEEIERNEFNLNLPRYIDSQEAEDIQDIAGHLQGGIPEADVEALKPYWDVCPSLRRSLFEVVREGYLSLKVEKSAIKSAIYEHPESAAFIADMNTHFNTWKMKTAASLRKLKVGCLPREVIAALAEDLLAHYTDKPLVDRYDIYQHLMDYWALTMQDDLYLIAADGWKAETYRLIEDKKDKEGKVIRSVDKGWACDLIPKSLIVARYYAKEQAEIESLTAELESLSASLEELEEEEGSEEGVFAEFEKINKPAVTLRLKEARATYKTNADVAPEIETLDKWLELTNREAELKRGLKDAEAELDALAYAQYPKLTEAEVKTLVVEDKWLAALEAAIHGEMDHISQSLTQRVKELSERYETPMPQLTARVDELEAKVNKHLEKMGFSWK
ncbi:Type I restriction enzyme EcoKI M protein [Anaerolineales bacterium]|nr:Type I restriction enzyme EcoKI M protein [Anaerolineales bacterium]